MSELTEDEKAIFRVAVSLNNASERQKFLRRVCRDNEPLLLQLEQLLTADAAAGVLESPAGLSDSACKNELVDAPSEQIGRYKILQKIGEGGFGDVYMAEQQDPVVRKVALKIVKLGMDTKQVVARFEAERQALAMMDHPHIAKVLDGGATETGRPFFVMELVRGIPIMKFCDQKKLSNQDRLKLFLDICGAIQHAHQKGIIHRDLKPSNILVTLHDGRAVPKVIDFGIAKATQGRLTGKTLFTRFEQFIGTPAYMSPEQAEMSGLDIDTRSDIYSLGVLLYELLTGQIPFDREELIKAGYDEVRRQIREQEPSLPSTRLSSLQHGLLTEVAQNRQSDPAHLLSLLRGELDWIVMKSMEKERSRRYETASALAEDIHRYLRQEPVSAVPPSVTYRFQKFARRNKALITLLSSIAAILVLAASISTWQALRAMRSEQAQSRLLFVAEKSARRAEAGELLAQRIAYASDMYSAHLALRLNNLGLARRLLDRNLPAHSAANDLRDWEWRALWLRTRGQADSVFGDPGQPIYSLSVSPHGEWLVTGGLKGEIRVWNTATGQLVRTLSPRTPREHGLAAFSPIGDRLYATAGDGLIKVWSVPSLSALPVELRHGSQIRAMSLSADGTLLAIFGLDEMISVWNLDAPEHATRLHGGYAGGEQMGAVAISPQKDRLAVGLREGIRIIHLDTLDEQVHIPLDNVEVTSLAFSPDGEILASGTGLTDESVDLWRVADGTRIDRLMGHTGYVFAVTFSPDGQRLASASADQTVRLWDPKTRSEIAVFREHENEVWAIDFDAEGRRLVSGGKNGDICVWNPHQGSPKWPIALRDQMPRGWHRLYSQASFSADGKSIATRNHDHSVSLRSAEDLEVTHRLTTLGEDNRGVRFSPRQRLLAVGDATGNLELLDPDQPQGMRRVELSRGDEIFPVMFSGDGRRLLLVARGESQSHCFICSVADGRITRSWSIPSDEECATFSPDGKLVVTGHYDGTLRFWDVANLQEPKTVRTEYTILGLAFSPDGKTLVVGSDRGEAEIWDMAKHSPLGRLSGLMQGVHDVQFSPDGERIATAGGVRESVKLWDFSTQQEVVTLVADGYTFRQVEFSPDGNAILTVNSPGSLHLWRVPHFEEIDGSESRQEVVVPAP